MARTYCEDCGCVMYNGFCTNCHEEVYIEEQYYDIGEDCPDSIYEKAEEQRAEVRIKLDALMN
jgi:hypothetical protein